MWTDQPTVHHSVWEEHFHSHHTSQHTFLLAIRHHRPGSGAGVLCKGSRSYTKLKWYLQQLGVSHYLWRWEQRYCMWYSIMDNLNCYVIACMIATLPLHALPPVSLHNTAVGEPTNVTVTLGERSIFLEWSPPSEGSPLSYTSTWTGSGVSSSHVCLLLLITTPLGGWTQTLLTWAPWKYVKTLPMLLPPGTSTPYHKVSCIQVVMVFQNTGVLWQTFIICTMHQACMQKHGTSDKWMHSVLHTLQFSQHCASFCMIQISYVI